MVFGFFFHIKWYLWQQLFPLLLPAVSPLMFPQKNSSLAYTCKRWHHHFHNAFFITAVSLQNTTPLFYNLYLKSKINLKAWPKDKNPQMNKQVRGSMLIKIQTFHWTLSMMCYDNGNRQSVKSPKGKNIQIIVIWSSHEATKHSKLQSHLNTCQYGCV